MTEPSVHSIAVVVPVYAGEHTLEALVEEISVFLETSTTPRGIRFRVSEVVLVHDHGRDYSAKVMRSLATKFSVVRVVWLSRNFGQHPATIAGISASGADWIVTIDEDGQFNPLDIPRLLDTAIAEKVPLVYGTARTAPPHSRIRNLASAFVKRVLAKLLIGSDVAEFSSFRLVLGELGRSVAAYAGSGVYLDVALHWMIGEHRVVRVDFRREGREHSGYSVRSLMSHFWRLVLSSGTRPLRFVSYAGLVAAMLGVILAALVTARRILYGFPVGFTSVFVTLLIIGGIMLVALGVVAEYIGLIARSSIGRPLYLAQTDPQESPLFRDSHPDR
jgi:glycosyltransferase involved in cell wall biosynthesis